MAARTKATPDDETQPEAQQEQDQPEVVAYDAQGNPLTEEPVEPEESGPLVDYTDADFTDPETGKPAPVSATTENLQGTVSNTNGRVLVKVAVRGYIGEEPVVVLAAHAGEFEELISQLADASAKQKAKFAKSQPEDEPAQ